MGMRITQNMMNSNMLRNLNRSMQSMDKYQQQLASGMKINRPSDDPTGAAKAMYFRSALIENAQFQRNANEAVTWMDQSDSALDEATQIMKRVHDLAIYSGNVGLQSDSLKAIAEEIDQIRAHMGNIANQTVDGRYIFAGTDTLHPPFDYSKGEFTNENGADVNLEMSKEVFVPINVNGQKVFNFPSKTDNVFNLLTKLSEDLKAGKDITQYIDTIDKQSDNINAVRSSLGARVNRIELINSRLQSEEVSLNKLMSDNEDADPAEVITNLKTQENAQRTALGVGARILQPSLLDFLR